MSEEVNKIITLNKMLQGKATLMLDANSAWDLPSAISFFEQISDCAVEYIEEPLRNFEELPLLFQKTGIPIALDENISAIPLSDINKLEWLNTVILKPSILGSIQSVLDLIKVASESNIKCIISDTFHSGIGLSFLLRLAVTIEQMVPMGFDTYSWLKDDILKKRLIFRDGCFNLKNINISTDNLDFSKLNEFSGSLSLYEHEQSESKPH
jgi:O-succinylbenzoate synthase